MHISNNDNEFIQVIREEAVRHLANVEHAIRAHEQQGADIDTYLVNKIFRVYRPLKSDGSIERMSVLQDQVHLVQSFIDLMRRKQRVPTPEEINTLLLANEERLQRLLGNSTAGTDVDDSTHITETGIFSTTVHHSAQQEKNIGVSVNLLDQLTNMACELVLSRNQLLHAIKSGAIDNVESIGKRIDQVTSGIKKAVVQTRMQPICKLLGPLALVVKDFAEKLDKQVELRLICDEMGIDYTIIEAMSDSLARLVKSRIDYSIESPEERRGKGKTACGVILLKVYQALGSLIIEIIDDGKGFDTDRIVQTAVAKGMVSPDRAKLMSSKDKANLIFLPGCFSAPIELENSDGCEVKMDEISSSLNQQGGSIEIESTSDKATSICIKLPLPLVILPCQIIRAGDEQYAIPQTNIVELLRISEAEVSGRIERVGAREVIDFRGDILPLVRIANLLNSRKVVCNEDGGILEGTHSQNIAASPLETGKHVDAEAQAGREQRTQGSKLNPAGALNIAVVCTGGGKYGLIIDEFLDFEETVIEPLGPHLRQCQIYAGATIMKSGEIALLLDVGSIARMSDLMVRSGSAKVTELAEVASNNLFTSQDRQALLTFYCSREEQLGVPLGLVGGVERIKPSEIENIGNCYVLQYRGGTLPLVSVEEVADALPLADRENLLVIVFQLAGKDVGLLASGPVGVIEFSANIDDITPRQFGIMGSASISGKKIMLVDIYAIVRNAFPEWGDTSTSLNNML